MKYFLAASFAIVFSASAQAQGHREIEFSQASELMPWCQTEAKAHFAGKGEATYQWSANHYSKGNTLIVEGQIRTDKGDVPVTCRVARGARERYAVVEIGK